VKGEGRSKRTRGKSRRLFDTYSQFPHTMPFVGVAAGLRDAIRSILNHSFSPHLASTGIHCLVAEVPLALRNHIFVPASFGENGADEYQELDETQAHWIDDFLFVLGAGAVLYFCLFCSTGIQSAELAGIRSAGTNPVSNIKSGPILRSCWKDFSMFTFFGRGACFRGLAGIRSAGTNPVSSIKSGRILRSCWHRFQSVYVFWQGRMFSRQHKFRSASRSQIPACCWLLG
jgi:hypothetical protein